MGSSLLLSLPDVVHPCIASYMGTADMLRFSLVARWARTIYMPQVKELRITSGDYAGTDTKVQSVHTFNPSAVESVLRPLHRLKQVELRDAGAITAFAEALKAGCGRSIEVLRAEDPDTKYSDEEQWQSVVNSMTAGGGLPALTSLHLGGTLYWGCYALFTPMLSQGGCPKLDTLVLGRNTDCMPGWDQDVDFMELLANALEARSQVQGCAVLRRLSLWGDKRTVQEGGLALTRVLQCCPCLEEFQFERDGATIGVIRPIQEWLTGASSHLHTLRIDFGLDCDAHLLLEALATRERGLQSLSLCCGIRQPSLDILASMFQNGVWDCLRSLELGMPEKLRYDAAVGALGLCCPNLSRLVVPEGGYAIAAAAARGGLSELTALKYGAWGSLDSGSWVRHILTAQHAVRTLSLEGETMSLEIAMGLTAAFTSGCALEELTLRFRPLEDERPLRHGFIGVEGWMALAMGLQQAGGAVKLRSLSLIDSEFSSRECEALLGALVGGACPILRRLCLSSGASGEPVKLTHGGMKKHLTTILLGGATCSSSLQELTIALVHRGPASSSASAWVRPDGVRLWQLSLMEAGMGGGDDGFLALAEAMEGAAESELRVLEVLCNRLTDRTRSVLKRVVRDGACPRLRRVLLGDVEVDSRVNEYARLRQVGVDATWLLR